MTRPAAALLVAILLGLLGPATAAALPILEEPDAVELAQSLAEAQSEQGVCYGWEIIVQDDQAGTTSVEGGSSQGPGQPLDRSRCPRFVVLEGQVLYTSESAEAEDDAAIGIASNLARPPTTGDLARLELDAGDLLEDTDDVALLNMVGALPLLVAENGQAPYIAFEPQREPLPATDVPTNAPGNDWLRTYWWLPVLGGVGVIALLLGLGSVVNRRRLRSP